MLIYSMYKMGIPSPCSQHDPSPLIHVELSFQLELSPGFNMLYSAQPARFLSIPIAAVKAGKA
jgi:hypothetical protein